jgi:hypothetical protein
MKDAVAISSNVYGTMAKGCACSPRGSNAVGFCPMAFVKDFGRAFPAAPASVAATDMHDPQR